MACDTCKSTVNISDITDTNFRNNIFVKIFLFVIGICLTVILIPIAWMVVFKIVFFNKETNIDLVDVYGKIFRIKKNNSVNEEEMIENNIIN